MNAQLPVKQLLNKIGGYYLIPHELLHVVAYRIIGKPYRYRWGDYQIYSLAPKTRREKLFVLLFPFVVCWILGLFFYLIWFLLSLSAQLPPEQYFSAGPIWHFIFPVLAFLCILYSGTSYQDLIDVYGWLFKHKAQYDSDQPHYQSQNEQADRH